MGLIFQPPWTRQPQAAAAVNTASPLSRGLSALWTASARKELVSGRPANLLSAGGYEAGRDGIALRTLPSTFTYVELGNSVDLLDVSECTVAVLRHSVDATKRTSGLFGCDNAADRALASTPGLGGLISWSFGSNAPTPGTISTAYNKDLRLETLVFTAGAAIGREIWRRGVRIANDPAAVSVRIPASNPFYLGISSLPSDNDRIYLCAVAKRAWSPSEIVSWCDNPWQIFAPLPRRIWVPVSAGAAPIHTTTGALTGTGAALAGAAVHRVKHTTTGALTGPGATVAGVARRTRAHPAAGTLAGAGSALDGTAVHKLRHTTTGALTGPGSTVAGAAARTRAHPSAGALVGSGSTVAGVAAHRAKHLTTGVLTGAGAALAGAATHRVKHTTTGALTGPGSALAGAAAHRAKHLTTGTLIGAGAALAGVAAHKVRHTTAGALAGVGAAMAGASVHSIGRPIAADRVRETTTSISSPFTVVGAPSGFQTFQTAFGIGQAFFVAIVLAPHWQVGVGRLTDANTLVIDSVLASSAGGAAVAFGPGVKEVFSTISGASITAAGFALLNDVNAAAQRITLGLGSAATSNIAGATTQVQYNNAGAFAASANFTYIAATNTVTFGHVVGSAPFMSIGPSGGVVVELGHTAGGLPTMGVLGASAVPRATTAGAGAVFSAGVGTTVNDASTFDGYTIKQVVKALREMGVLT